MQIATRNAGLYYRSCNLCLHTPRADCNAADTHGAVLLQTLPPHAPCRLQRSRRSARVVVMHFASTRPVQIATKRANKEPYSLLFASTRPVQIATATCCCRWRSMQTLCLHTPRADCNLVLREIALRGTNLCLHTPRADCNGRGDLDAVFIVLCLHTPRADCNTSSRLTSISLRIFASTRPVQIATRRSVWKTAASRAFASTRPVQIATTFSSSSRKPLTFASTRPVQIATESGDSLCARPPLCLHTPRADCNQPRFRERHIGLLCLHTPRADCNRSGCWISRAKEPFASTRPVQIATQTDDGATTSIRPLPPHAPCRLQPRCATPSPAKPTFASTRPVQIATASA